MAAAPTRETITASTAEAFATTRDPPHADRLALGSITLEVLAAAFDTVKDVIEVLIH